MKVEMKKKKRMMVMMVVVLVVAMMDGGKDADGRREKIELVKKKEESLQTSPPLASTELIVGKYHCIRNQLYIFSPKEHWRNIEMYLNRTLPC